MLTPPTPKPPPRSLRPMWLSSLCCDVIVSDSALTRRAFPGAFVNPAPPQVDVEAQQLPLSDAEGALAVLGMAPKMGFV